MSTAPNPNAGSGAWLICRICNQHFSRPEHRRRHEAIHAGDKLFKCDYCGKTFARKDAAKRHKDAHERVLLPQLNSSVTLRGSCSACNRSRVKCSGGDPCKHCAVKMLVCTYENRKKRRTIYDQTDHAQRSASLEQETDCQDVRSAIALIPTIGDTSGASQLESAEELALTRHDLPTGQYKTDHIPCPSGVRPSAETCKDRPDMPNSSCQLQSIEKSSTRDLDPLLASLMETNWLPFDQSVGNSPNPSIAASHTASLHRRRVEAPSTRIADEDELDTNHFISMEMGNIFSQNDRVSTLIASMSIGLPGLSSLAGFTMPRESLGDMNIASLYSDGAGARTSQSDRRVLARQENRATYGEILDHSGNPVPPWIAILRSKMEQNQSQMHFSVPDDVYTEAYVRISREWTDSPLPPLVLGYKDTLLDKVTLEFFIQLYFENFHSVYPFLDRSLISIPVWGWSLYLAAAAIGARYLRIPEVTLFGDGVCSLLNEILFEELGFNHIGDSLPYIQARILTAIGLCHSRHSSFMNCGYNVAGLVFNSCMRLRLLEEDDRIGAFQPEQDIEQMWIAWRFRETRRRTGFFIYVTDCILAYMTRTPPRLPLNLMKLIVPSADGLWEAETCQKWLLCRTNGKDGNFDFADEEWSRPRIQDVLHHVWTNLRPPWCLGDFGTTSLIHLLIRRVWDPPWPQCQPLKSNIFLGYPAEVSSFSKWRNGTCDCLDVLHWDALSLSAKAGGLEGPVFLQLHLSRLLLLAPFRQLFSHIQTCRRFPSNYLLPHDLFDGPESDSDCRQTIATWVWQDRHKARLAVVHAGSIFWHVRRYSSDSFAQSFAVFLAAITLWAYGKFYQLSLPETYIVDEPLYATVPGHEQPDQPEAVHNISVTSPGELLGGSKSPNVSAATITTAFTDITNEKRMPNFIQLDRPIDDELVQHFIRSGEGMTLHLEGVENLCSSQGIEQVLREAVLILKESKDVWSIAESYSDCLHGILGP